MDYIKLFQNPSGTINYTKPIERFVKPTIYPESQDGTAIPILLLSEKSSLPEYLRPFALLYPGLTYEELVQKYNEYILKEKPTLSQGRTTKPNAYELELTEIKKRLMEMLANELEQAEQKEEAIKTIGALTNLISPSFYLEQTGVEMTPIEKFLADYILDPTIYLSGGIGTFKHFNPSDVVRLLRLLKNNMVKPRNYSMNEINALKRHLNELGVDVSKFNDLDFNKMLSIREVNLHNTAPDVYNVIYPEESQFRIDAYNSNYKGKIGQITLKNSKEHPPHHNIGYIWNLTPLDNHLKGVSEQLYNSAIIADQQMYDKGIVSGEVLRLPEKTTKVLSRYQDKQIIDDAGVYNWESGQTSNNPVYLFNSPTYYTPTKSILFNPKSVSSTGKMKISWEDKDIYKSILPLTLLTTNNANEN